MPANRLQIAFTPQALDYVYAKLAQCPFAEVHQLLAEIAAQVKAQQESDALPVIETPSQ